MAKELSIVIVRSCRIKMGLRRGRGRKRWRTGEEQARRSATAAQVAALIVAEVIVGIVYASDGGRV